MAAALPAHLPRLGYIWTMPQFSFEGRSPTVDPTAFVAPTATLIGDVTIEAGASVWFNAVLRGDYAPVIVREGANVQDGAVLHAPPGIPVVIGARSMIAAGALVVGGTQIPAEVLVVGAPATIKGAIAGTSAEMWVNVNAQAYQDLARRYLAGLEPIP
jgi:carbonic anhydrase/acetyltransferase-like protein (isoleucine patch superfamily)